MPRRTMRVAFAALVVGCLLVPGQALGARQNQPLQQFVVSGKGADPEALARAGYDLRRRRTPSSGYLIVATPSQAAKLESKDVSVRRSPEGSEQRRRAAEPAAGPDARIRRLPAVEPEPAPCPASARRRCCRCGSGTPAAPREHRRRRAGALRQVAPRPAARGLPRHPRRAAPAGAKPVVLYHATQHAREWIATETNRRLFDYVLAHKNDPASGIPQILATTELWFVPVVNPDGYDYTFVSEDTRLWRKTLRDNDGDGLITTGDGVDPNRNWPTKWRFDPEGASDNPASETYRGPRAGVRARGHRLPRADEPAQGEVHDRLPLLRRADPVSRGLAGRDARRPTTRCWRRWPAATRPTPPSRAMTPTCPPSSTRSTATSPTTRSTSTARRPTRWS